ncbi:MAG: leucine-rich repeat protein [Clostridia bacterium]|nr:leucine-rich repeat protein [Clostridia bacterium]
MKTLKKVISAVLAVVMLLSVASVTVFAEGYTFEYIYADSEYFSTIYITAFDGTVPEDGYVEIPAEIDGCIVIGIAEHTFDNLQELRGIILPSADITIDPDAFYGCTQEIDVVYPEEPEEDEDEKFDPEEWYEDHVQDYVIKDDILVKYQGTDKIVTIPYNCKEIAEDAFRGNENITTVYLVKELEKIGDYAFADCKYLANVIIASGTDEIEIGKDVFAGTPWLENFPSDFVNIGTTLIKYKGELDSVSIPNVFRTIAPNAFALGEEKAEDIVFKVRVPATIENFGEDCFFLYDSLTKVYPELVVYKNTPAEEYLTAEGIDFTYFALPGDAVFDGVITAGDARYVLRVAAKLEEPIVDADKLLVADLSGDNKIAAEDARLILRIAAKLDKYSAEDLYTMPRTDYEVLLTAANALSLARGYGCAYSKNAYQYISDVKMNTNTKTYLNMYNSELTSEKKAVTVTYNQNTPEAYDNLFDITLLDSGKIKSHSCVVEDGKYYITLVLKDETVAGSDLFVPTFTEKMFPVETVAHFTSKAMNKYWYNDSIKYNMTYNDCTIKMVVNVDNLKIDTIDLQMNYDFEIEGKIMGIAIKDGKNPATATRTDVVRYSNFVYFSK